MNIVRAPDFPKDFAWLNTDQPLSFRGNLKGQVVLLDFWTYCCINCMHLLPELDTLQHRFKDQPFIIIGVHSAKYTNEQDSANIRAAIQRYGVHHPVVVDEDHRIWSDYAVRAWPTLVLVGPDGRIVGGVSGEGHLDLLQHAIDKTLTESRAAGTLAPAPLKLAQDGTVPAASGLAFPGCVVADPPANDRAHGRLFVVDSNHNRILVTAWPDENGHAHVLQIIGNGEVGSTDGSFSDARFNRPQGAALAPAGNILWVADTENHLIRRLDLQKNTVTTVLGTGEQKFDPEAGKSGRNQPLNSPWDVAVQGNRLYISQAGQHQLWAMNLMTGMAEVVAGSGREDLRDGPAADAALAQPSAIALDTTANRLYFADSETSSVRFLDLHDKQVHTLVGHGLFTFGDRDGPADTALLQHCIGLALSEDRQTLYVADSYNHKIKAVSTADGSVRTIAGTGKPGTGSADILQLFEPAGIAVAPTCLFIADTNNQRIVQFTPDTGQSRELVFDGLHQTPGHTMPIPSAADAGAVAIDPHAGLTVHITPAIPKGAHLTPQTPLSLRVTDAQRVLYTGTADAADAGVSFRLPKDSFREKPELLYLTLIYSYCTEGQTALCVPAEASWKVAVRYQEKSTATLRLEASRP
ncbi:MAG TPA: thioredoxin-like domain-containing protein [Phycisphaerae bacterium]|nr:thioredoxin-like domain-containing protein [Phycisphaerae bacterium]